MPFKKGKKVIIKSIEKIDNNKKKIIYSNNNEYIGETDESNLKQGKGKIIFYDFSIYDGQWNNDNIVIIII